MSKKLSDAEKRELDARTYMTSRRKEACIPDVIGSPCTIVKEETIDKQQTLLEMANLASMLRPGVDLELLMSCLDEVVAAQQSGSNSRNLLKQEECFEEEYEEECETKEGNSKEEHEEEETGVKREADYRDQEGIPKHPKLE